MNVFVLGTGRCGTVTFSRACRHLTNFTTGHETNAKKYGDSRHAYPTRHIEVDSRLTWFLGQLGQRYPDALYFHLRREREATALSIARKWHGGAISFARAFGEAMVMRGHCEPEDRIRLALFQYDTATANINHFLRDKNSRAGWLHEYEYWFPDFLDWIDAEGNREAAMREWETKHNASPRNR